MFKSLVGFVFASGSVVVACGSSSTTGTNKGGLGGLFGSPSGGSGTTTGGTTTGNVLPANCTVSPTEDACTTCLKQSCCTSLTGCSGNAECNALVNCIVACNGDDMCGTNCVDQHPAGKMPAQEIVSCEQQSCISACESDSSGTASSSSGSNGTSDCLEDPPDTTLCTTIAGKTHAHDCPNGPPQSTCVAQPEGLHGIWCCPQ